ncbi:helix-turn-helix transcriptional regulator [Nonomuraea sp. NPDC049784]|uniref:helix-turn-helix domain-containing protein n=1 Tax=Nonomuraea sp. NPDC049784 TaxID=3154361 RepID=UPI003401C6C0
MHEGSTTAALATRLQTVRKRHGLSQAELAEAAGISVSMISKVERGEAETRLETVHKIAKALNMSTTDLLGNGGDAQDEPDVSPAPELWAGMRKALIGHLGQPDEEPTVEGLEEGLAGLKALLANNHYSEIAALLPPLLRDADALNGQARALHSRVLNAAGWVLTQTRQYIDAEAALKRAVDVADDRLDAAAAINTMVWLHLRQGQLAGARRLAEKWADEIEPRFSRATTHELTLWGRLLLGLTNAAVRDNRPGDAEDALQMAQAAAVRIGREVLSDTSTTRTFGPVTVLMIRAENAAITEKPDKVLSIADRIPATMPYAHSASRNRHRLDVAKAYAMTRMYPEAVATLQDLTRIAPEWIRAQRYARDILQGVIDKRRTLTPEMREVADAVNLPY